MDNSAKTTPSATSLRPSRSSSKCWTGFSTTSSSPSRSPEFGAAVAPRVIGLETAVDSQRAALPHEAGRLFLTDGGTETWLIHKRGAGATYWVTRRALSKRRSSQEAIGIVRAAESAGLPLAISFMVEKNHCLGSGESLRSAIETVDLATSSAAAYFMINCAHPVDFDPALVDRKWVTRMHGIRANASKLVGSSGSFG
jgi:hypothetical protein